MVTKVTEWNDVEKVLNGFGIALRDTAGTFKDADTIISELGENWQTYNSVQKNAIATAVAGTRQREVFYSTMENWEQVGKAARIAADSQGNAAQKMDAYTDSVQAAKNRITAAVEKLTQNLHLQGLLKDFYKVTAGLIDNIGLVSTAVAGFLMMTKGKSLMSAIFGDGKFLNNAMYKMMGVGMGTNNQGSIFSAFKDQYGGGQWKKNLNEMANLQSITAIERTIATGSKINSAAVNNFLNLGTNTFGDAKAQAAISKYVLKLDENGVMLEQEAEERVQLLNAIKESLTVEEKENLAETILTEAEIQMAEEITKADMEILDLSKMTAEEVEAAKKKITADNKAEIALLNYAEILEKASVEEKRMIANFYKRQSDPNFGVKSFKQGAIATGLTTAGAMAPLMFSKGAGALGEKFGMDESTGTMVGMFGMSALGNAAAKNSKAILEGGKAFATAAKGAQAASSAVAGSGGLLAAFSGMSTAMKAGASEMMAVEGAMLGLATAGALVVGVIAMAVMQAQEKAKEARAEAYKDAKSEYDAIVDATATFNESRYSYLAAGVDQYGNNISLTNDEYEEFVETSNRLAEVFPELVTYTDEAGNKFLDLGSSAKEMGDAIEQATKASRDARDEALIRTMGDQAKELKKQRIEIGKRYQVTDEFGNTTVDTSNADYQREISNLNKEYADYALAEANILGLDELSQGQQALFQQEASNGSFDITQGEAEFRAEIQGYLDFLKNVDTDMINAVKNPNQNVKASALTDGREQTRQALIDNFGEDYSQWDKTQKMAAGVYGFEVDNGELVDTYNILEQIKTLIPDLDLDGLGISDKTIAEAKEVYTLINEGVITAQTTKEELDSIMSSQIVDGMSDAKLDQVKQVRTEAAAKVTADELAKYTEEVVGRGVDATIEETTKKFPGVAEEVAQTITKEVNGASKDIQDTFLDKKGNPKKNEKGEESAMGKKIKEQQKYNKLLDIQARKEKVIKKYGSTKKAQKSHEYKDLEKELKEVDSEASKKGGLANITDIIKDQESTVKKSTGNIAKYFKKNYKNSVEKSVKSAADSINEVDLTKAQNAYQQFFSSIEDENNSGYLDTWNEYKNAFAQINEHIQMTSDALDEQKEYGKLSAQTVLDLVSANEDYLSVLEVKDGKIQMAANAEETMHKAEMQQLQTQMKIKAADMRSRAAQIDAILKVGQASSSTLQSLMSEGEGTNNLIDTKNADMDASYGAANATGVLSASVLDLAHNCNNALPAINAMIRAKTELGKEKGGSTVSAAPVNQTQSSGLNYGEATHVDKADVIDLNSDENAELRAGLEQQRDALNKGADVLENLSGNLDSVDGFKAGYTPGGGKSGGGGGGGGSGDKYTKLDHVKDILDAINKEYQQMIAYDKQFGVGNNINVSYYAKRKKYLQEEIELLKKKMKKDWKKKDKSDYYSDIKDYQQARIDLKNLDDEKIQDKIDLLEARKELTGISYKYEIGLYKQLLKTADTEQERLEYEKKLIDAQREEIQNQKEIAEAMKDTLSIENAMMLAYKGISLTSKKTSSGYSLTSNLPGLDSITIKGTDGHTATGFENSLNKKRAAAVEKAKKKYKYVKVGKDDTGTLQYAYSNKNALTAEKNLAKKIMSANTSMSSDTIDADWAYITDSFGNRHWYPKSKANSTTVKNIKNYKKKGYYVAISLDDSGKLHFVKHKKTKKYTKKKAKSALTKKAEQAKDYANTNIQHQDNGGSTQEHNSKVKKTAYDKAIDEALDWLKNEGTATPKEQIEKIDKSIDERAAAQRNVAMQIAKEMQTHTVGSAEYIKLYGELIEALREEEDIEKEKIQKRIDLLDAAGITNELTIAQYENLLASSQTIEEEWENQKKLNDLTKEYNKLLRDTLEYRYALYENILEYESYTPSKDANSQYMKAIEGQQKILEKEMEDAKNQAEQYRKMAFDANVKAYMLDGMSETEAKDKAWKDSENDSDYQEAVNQYVEAFQKMGELVIRQFNDIADAIGRKLDKLEQERAEEWRSTWNSTWENEGKLVTKAQDKIKAYYGSVQAMQEQIKAEALSTLKDVTYLTDEQVQELVDKYNEAAVEIHQAMIDQMQDTVDYQDTLYNAVVDEVNDIIFNLEKQKELTEEMYDDEIEALQKKEESITRTNELLEKQKALQDALNDRQRVYKSGIGWTYEANRDAIKQAQKDLDTFKDEDRLNDLEKAKEDELNELDEKIKNWEDYLTMLEYQYNEYERIERQRLLMEVTGAEDMRGVHEFLVDDMENFTDYVKNNQSAFLENAIKAYTDYNTAFGGFLDDYEKNQLRLYDLLGEQKELLNEEQFFRGNGTPLENFINNQLNGNWSDTTKELYDALTGAKYGDSPYSPGDTEQLAAAAAIKQREANGEKVQVIDQNGKYYNSLAEFEKAQATNGDLKIAAYKSDNSKQVGGGAVNTNALYDTNTGNAVTTATGSAVSNALATDNGKTTYIKVGDKAVDAKDYTSITLNPDGTATFVDKNGNKATGELIQLGSNDYGKVTNTTTSGTSMADLYSKYGDGSIYAIGENGQILRTAKGSYQDGVVTYAGGTQKSGYEVAGGNNGVVDTNSYTDVTRSTTDYGEDYVYKTSAGSDIIKMLAKYEGGNVALVDDGNGGVKVVAGNKSTVDGSTYTTSGGTNYQIVGDATSTAALDAAISARTGGKADSSTLGSGGSTVTQMIDKYDNVAYVSDGNGGVRLVGGNNSTITTDKKTGKQYYTPAGSKKSYEIVSVVEKNGKGYSEGIKNGPVTYTGLAMLHGSPMNPEYVLNSAQAGQLLYNMATKDMAYESIIEKYSTTNNSSGDAFNIGEINVQAESPQEFFDQLMQVVNGRYSTTKNRR